MQLPAGMTADRSAARSQGAIQETAQALVTQGELAKAVRLLDRYLSEFDGDWGVWLYFGGLCARLGKRDEAVAAYRACARQLEGDGHFELAREALMNAVRLVPGDEALAREVALIGTPPPRRPDPSQETFLLLPTVDPKGHLTAVIPGRVKRPPAPPPEVTDPYIAIFDILDAERAQAVEKRSATRRERAPR